jgi:Holliday junction resolvase RusA-like endonuclease
MTRQLDMLEQQRAPLAIWVGGDPWPQGSKTIIKGRLVEYFNLATPKRKNGSRLRSGGELKSWRRVISLVAQAHMRNVGGEIIKGPAWVSLHFFMQPRYIDLDIDKCVRAVLDALSGVAYVDDRQVLSIRGLEQDVCDPAIGPGVEIGWGAR